MRSLPLLFLFGCLGPTGASVCYDNAITSAQICELDLERSELDQRQQDCDYNEGYVQSVGCATDYKKLTDCVSNAIAGKACEDINDAINEECAYLAGRLQGCLPQNNPAQ